MYNIISSIISVMLPVGLFCAAHEPFKTSVFISTHSFW